MPHITETELKRLIDRLYAADIPLTPQELLLIADQADVTAAIHAGRTAIARLIQRDERSER